MAETTERCHTITNLSTPTWEMPDEDDSGLGMSLLDDQSPYATQFNYHSLGIGKGNGSESGTPTLPATELIPKESHQFVTTLSFGNELMIANQCLDDDDISEKENRPPVMNNISASGNTNGGQHNTTGSGSRSNGPNLEYLARNGGDFVSKVKQFGVEADRTKNTGTSHPVPDDFDNSVDVDIPITNPSLIITTVHLVRSQRTSPPVLQILSPSADQPLELQSEKGNETPSSCQSGSNVKVVYKPRGLDPVGNMIQQELLKSTHRDREQDRHQLMKAAFIELGHVVRVNPRDPSARRPARLTILQAAIDYIRYLEALLDIYDSDNCDS